MSLRWGVLGARSRIHRQRLRPAFELAGERIVAEASRRGDDLAPYDEVVADPDVEAIYIPLPNALHVEWITKALEAGKHVLCEKPLTLAAAETSALYEVAAAAGRHLGEAFMWPHHPRAKALLQLIETGELGRLVAHHGTFQYVLDRADDHRLDDRGGGALFDVGIYCLGPALLMSSGELGAVSATATRNEAGIDTAMTGWVELAPGTAATFVVSCESPPCRHQELVGTEGMVVIENHSPGPDRPGSLTIGRLDGSRDEVAFAGANAYERMITAFVAACRGEAEPVWPPHQSMRLAILLDRLHAATAPTEAELNPGQGV